MKMFCKKLIFASSEILFKPLLLAMKPVQVCLPPSQFHQKNLQLSVNFIQFEIKKQHWL